MEKIDAEAVKKLRTIMDSRGVDYHTGRNISLRVIDKTQEMVDWLEENPEASLAEIIAKSRNLHKLRWPFP